MTSEILSYHYRSPNPVIPGCLATGNENEDGVVFNGFEPDNDAYAFVGRTAIIEAMALLTDLTVKNIMDSLEQNKKLRKRIVDLEHKNTELRKKARLMDELNKVMDIS